MKRFFSKLYVQVLIGVAAGVLLGVLNPTSAANSSPWATCSSA